MTKPKTHSNNIFAARTIGAFFILAFLAYGLGRHLFESANSIEKYLGASLIAANSIMVFFIGILFSKTLRRYNPFIANVYLGTRLFEALALGSLILNLFLKTPISEDLGYFFAMFVLGLGSIPMCLTLAKHKIAPNYLAIWGVLGYAVFSFGFLMELFGKAWSMYFLGLGGLWEISFAVWLMFYGSKSW